MSFHENCMRANGRKFAYQEIEKTEKTNWSSFVAAVSFLIKEVK